MRRQRALNEAPAPPDVHDREDRPVSAVLNGDRTRVAAVAIDEVREREDPFVAKPDLPVEVDHPREVALLRPELGCVRELPEQIRNDLVAVERRPLRPEAEMLLGDVPCEYASGPASGRR